MEPLLPPDERSQLYNLYDKARSAFWVDTEILYTADVPDWEKMNAKEKHFIELILGFFAVSDRIVLHNLVENFVREIDFPEAKLFYNFQAVMEDIHSLTYTKHLMTLVKDPERIHQLLHSIEYFPSIALKSEWAMKWMDRSRPIAERLVAFAVVEAVYFSASFCSIFWFKEQNKLKHGVGTSNEFISRDEALHAEFACVLYRTKYPTLPSETITSIITDAVRIEEIFVDEALPGDGFVGMTSDLMKQYIHYVADRLALQLGLSEPIYGVTNPFVFMTNLSLMGKTNFFEKKVTEYSKVNVSSDSLCAMDDF